MEQSHTHQDGKETDKWTNEPAWCRDRQLNRDDPASDFYGLDVIKTLIKTFGLKVNNLFVNIGLEQMQLRANNAD